MPLNLFGKKKEKPPPKVANPKPPPPGTLVLAPDAQSAAALDAADGVIDGKYYGAPVYQRGPGYSQPPAPQSGAPAPAPQRPAPAAAPAAVPPIPPPAPYYATDYAPRPAYRAPSLTRGYRSYDSYAGVPERHTYAPYGLDEPLDPRNYNGTVVSVEYVVHEPGWQGAPHSAYGGGYADPGYGSGTLAVPRSYPSRYADQYEAPGPRYEPPPPPPRYTPPQQPPRYEPPPPQQQPSTGGATEETPNLRPWFGVAVKWLDDLDQGGHNNVAVVHEVIPDSPAWKAGIQVDDQLEYWENTKLDSEAVWKAKIATLRIGDVINMGIHRNHRDQRVLVRIEGTTREKGIKKMVYSATATHTDN